MANNSASLDFKNLIQDWQGNQKYRDLNWSGTFNDYLNLVKENPKITRNAFQRMYDLIIECGKTDYVQFKKPIARYKFFDDEQNDGKDAVFGLDVPLMKLVNVLKSAALGYGTEKRVILLHGPVGSAKSTICRMLKKGVEAYSKTDKGALYTFEWVDENNELGGILGKDVKAFPSPMHEEPLRLITGVRRPKICEELNRGSK